MEWFSATWEWLGREIAAFGLRWIVVGTAMLGFSGWFGWRYREMRSQTRTMKERIAALEAKSSAPVVNVNLGAAPLAGDVDRIVTITQAEYDALPEKDPRTLYLFKNDNPPAPVNLS